MYTLIEYSKNYRKTTGNLWNYYRDEPNNPPNDNYNADSIRNSVSLNTKAVLQEEHQIKITLIITGKMLRL